MGQTLTVFVARSLIVYHNLLMYLALFCKKQSFDCTIYLYNVTFYSQANSYTIGYNSEYFRFTQAYIFPLNAAY